MHRRDRIPNKTDSAFRPPVGFEPKSRRAEISVATGGVERPAFDPPSPGISRDRGGGRRPGGGRLWKGPGGRGLGGGARGATAEPRRGRSAVRRPWLLWCILFIPAVNFIQL